MHLLISSLVLKHYYQASEIAEGNVNPFNKFKVGDSIEVLIKKFTPQEHRIALSIKDMNNEEVSE